MGLLLLEDLTGAGRSSSWMAHRTVIRRCQFLVCGAALSDGCFLKTWLLFSFGVSNPKQSKERGYDAFL